MISAAPAAVPVAWLVARSAGLVAFVLFTVSVTLGLTLSTRLLGTRRGKMLLGWHQTLMWTGIAMVALHGAALAIDPVMRFGVGGVLVPGVAPWRPVPVAAGIVTAWTMLALAASFRVRRRIGQRRWRQAHYASFAAFTIGLYHALNVGTDLTGTRGLIFAGIVAAPVVWLVYARILLPRPEAGKAPIRPTPSLRSTTAQQPNENRRATGVGMTEALRRVSFRAMGTNCEAAVTIGPGDVFMADRALAAARAEVAVCERVLSRFDACSDVSRLNRAAGGWVAVDARMIGVLAAALRGRADTHGLFDPTILPALTAAGYDRSFELLAERAGVRLRGWQADAQIDVDPVSGKARVERGAAVDLGGIGKGFAATSAIEAMRTAWPTLAGGLVDLGGDIALWGTPPAGGPWRVEIADPRAPEQPFGTLELTRGGVATSGRDTRRFGAGRQFHHLIDPATGQPASAGPLAVTVKAADATEADAYATALGIATFDDTRDLLAARPDIGSLLIPQFGEPVVIGPLPLTRDRPAPRLVVNTQVGRFAWH